MGKTEPTERLTKTIRNDGFYVLIVIYDNPIEFLRMSFHENVSNVIPYGKYHVKRIKANPKDKLTIPPIKD